MKIEELNNEIKIKDENINKLNQEKSEYLKKKENMIIK